MNTNLKTLLEQAGYYPDLCDPIRPNFHNIEKIRYMKFSELMVEYCANLMQEAADLNVHPSEYPEILRNRFKNE